MESVYEGTEIVPERLKILQGLVKSLKDEARGKKESYRDDIFFMT